MCELLLQLEGVRVLPLFGLQYIMLRCVGGLSVYVFFMLSWDTPTEVYLQLFYFNLQKIRHFILFLYYSSQTFTYHTNFESIDLWYFVTQYFAADKYIYDLSKSLITNPKKTLKYRSLSGVGRSLWGRSWLWFKWYGFHDS